MDTKLFITKLFAKKEIVDYTYVTLFFIISTLFAFFAIRPSLTIAFTLRKEAQELKKINDAYEKNIIKIIALQSQLEAVRSKTYLVNEATPSKPEIKIVIDNLQKITVDETVRLKEFTIPETVLKSDPKNSDLKNIPISLALESEYQELNAFIKSLFLKRRLTVIKNLEINKVDSQSTGSAGLEYNLSIENYYL